MDFSKIIGGAKTKADKMLHDFNKALPILRDLGLSVGKVSMKLGLIPSMQARLRGSIDSLNRPRIQQLIAQHQQNKIAVTVLKGLLTATNVQNIVEGIPFKGVEVRLNLGILFSVQVNFIRDNPPGMAAKPQISDGSPDSKGDPEETIDSQDAA